MRRSERNRGRNSSVIGSGASSALMGYLLTMILLYIMAVLIYAGILDEGLAEEMVLGSAFIGATVSAMISAKRWGSGVITSGLVAGAIFCCMAIVTSIGISGGEGMGIMTLKMVICSLAGGAFGGAMCLNTKRNKKSRR